MLSPPHAISQFAANYGLVKRDRLRLPAEIDLDDAVRIEKHLCLAGLLSELHPFTRNRRDDLPVVGSHDADLLLAVVRFHVVAPGLQLLSADCDRMINHQLR